MELKTDEVAGILNATRTYYLHMAFRQLLTPSMYLCTIRQKIGKFVLNPPPLSGIVIYTCQPASAEGVNLKFSVASTTAACKTETENRAGSTAHYPRPAHCI